MTTDTTLHPSPTLARLLDDELAFSPSIRGTFSNHAAMALVAAHRLGAPPERLEELLRHDRRWAEPHDDHDVLRDRLHEVERAGIVATVRSRVPALADGPGTALFHPLIRLAYGLDAQHPGQVAAALLDWERRHELLGPDPSAGGTRRLADGAAELTRSGSAWTHTYDLAEVAGRPAVAAVVRSLDVGTMTLDDLSAFALAAHVAADDFLTLHLVTGARAVRTVAPHLDEGDVDRLVTRSAVVMAVTFAAVGAPGLLDPQQVDSLRRSPLPSREVITTRALASDDPHVLKLADVALVEESRTDDPLYRLVAARVVGLAP